MKKKLVLPKFKNIDEEMEFWDKLDLTDYYEPGDLVQVKFPNLKPTPYVSVSIRLPNSTIEEIKSKAEELNLSTDMFIELAIAENLAKP